MGDEVSSHFSSSVLGYTLTRKKVGVIFFLWKIWWIKKVVLPLGYNSKTSEMIKETNYRLFLNEFSKLMEKHFNKMDKTCYLNGRDEVVSITLEQQTPLFVNFFWTQREEIDLEGSLKLMKYLSKDQDIMFYNLNYRDRLNREVERFLLENIHTPIYI